MGQPAAGNDEQSRVAKPQPEIISYLVLWAICSESAANSLYSCGAIESLQVVERTDYDPSPLRVPVIESNVHHE